MDSRVIRYGFAPQLPHAWLAEAEDGSVLLIPAMAGGWAHRRPVPAAAYIKAAWQCHASTALMVQVSTGAPPVIECR